jgi:hypothetical protein
MHEHGKGKRQDQEPDHLPPQHVHVSNHLPIIVNSSRDAIIVPKQCQADGDGAIAAAEIVVRMHRGRRQMRLKCDITCNVSSGSLTPISKLSLSLLTHAQRKPLRSLGDLKVIGHEVATVNRDCIRWWMRELVQVHPGGRRSLAARTELSAVWNQPSRPSHPVKPTLRIS